MAEEVTGILIGGVRYPITAIMSAGGQGFNREDATGTTTPEKFTWPSGSRPSLITVTAYNPGAVDVYLWVCFDAPDAATAAAWLAGAAGEAVDSQRYMVLPIDTASVLGAINVSGAPKDFEFTAPLSNMYYVTSTSTCAIHVEAS